MLRGFGGGGRTELPRMGGTQGSLRGSPSGGHWEGGMQGRRWTEGQGSAEKCRPSSPLLAGPKPAGSGQRQISVDLHSQRWVVSRKRRGRGLSGLQGSVKLGCLLPPSDVQRGPQVASEVWGCSLANLLLVEGALAPSPPAASAFLLLAPEGGSHGGSTLCPGPSRGQPGGSA